MTSTTVSDIGLVRKNNQDSAFAGIRLIAVCDGMGGHAGGDTASTIAIRSLAHIETHQLSTNKSRAVDEVASMLSTSVIAAHDAIVGKADREKQLAGMGTTVTAVVLVNGYWIAAHIGDSRAYMVREGEIIRVTKDHSYVQHLIDTGRITEEEAHSHPQRNVVMRVLGDFDIDPRPDITVRKAQAGDRWMLCSDGLCGVLSDDTIRETLMTHPHMQECAQTLVGMALKGGSTDNVTVAIADCYDLDAQDAPISLANASAKMSLVAGAASADPQPLANVLNTLVAVAPAFEYDDTLNSPALRAAQLTNQATGHMVANQIADQTADQTLNQAAAISTDGGQSYDQEPAQIHNAQQDGSSVSSSQDFDTSADTLEELLEGSKNSRNASDEHDDERFEIQRVVRPASADVDIHDDVMAVAPTGEIPIVRKATGEVSDDPHDPDVAQALRIKRAEDARKARKRRKRTIAINSAISAAIIAILCVIGWQTYSWSQSQYYVSDSDGYVAIYQGVNTNIFHWNLSHKIEDTDTKMSDLPQGWQNRIKNGITVKDYPQARRYVKTIESQAHNDSSTKDSGQK
ncbi:PP2C family protein-serine/threonine phosphatase [Alloscardovia venturai]|uniref:PP2C family protein-serine/threonine phosphatase n=1 Tax=Alloscardovia venturai TaxID=1769421 RepID=A0ABW2Y7P6_9BIFI